MNPVVTGIVVACALIAAVVVGTMIDFDVDQDGPLEQAGEALDDAANN